MLACQAAKAAPQLTLILKDVETFTDKLARHPELIGIGGAHPAEQRAEGPAVAAAGPHHPADAPVSGRASTNPKRERGEGSESHPSAARCGPTGAPDREGSIVPPSSPIYDL